MPKITVRLTEQTIRFIWTVGILLLLVSGWLWWSRVYNNPARVFWGMIDNSLATSSITRHVSQSGESQSSDQLTRLHFGNQTASRNLETQGQKGETGDSTVIQELLGTPSSDYARFVRLDIAAMPGSASRDYSSIEGVWGKSSDAPEGQKPAPSNFNQAALGTVPFASFNLAQRQSLVQFMRDKNVYSVDYSKVTKQQENGKAVYVYDVQIQPRAYFEMLQQFARQLGLGDIPGLDPAQYEGVEPLQVKFSVVRASRQLIKIHYTSSEQDEFYVGHGITAPINLPANTIPVSELQQRIQSVE